MTDLSRQKLLSTTDAVLFLENEYVHFQHILKSKESFEQAMADMIEKCDVCGVLHWRACEKRCNCDYPTLSEKTKPVS
jgi:hypothetical protein